MKNRSSQPHQPKKIWLADIIPGLYVKRLLKKKGGDYVKKLAKEIAEKNGVQLKSITRYGNDGLLMITFLEESGTEKYLNLVYIGDEPKHLHFVMSRNYLLNAAKEEQAKYPEGSVVYQDSLLAYVVTDLNPESCLTLTPMERIYLSPKTHALYETVSGYVKGYESVQEALDCYNTPFNMPDDEGKKMMEYLREQGTYEKQIIEPMMKALSLLLGYKNYKCIPKDTPYGTTYSLGFWDDDTKTILVLVMEKRHWGDGRRTVGIQMIDSVQDGVPVMVPVPDRIPDICRILKQRERRK